MLRHLRILFNRPNVDLSLVIKVSCWFVLTVDLPFPWLPSNNDLLYVEMWRGELNCDPPISFTQTVMPQVPSKFNGLKF